MFVPSSVLDEPGGVAGRFPVSTRRLSPVLRFVRMRTLRLAWVVSTCLLFPACLPSFPCSNIRRCSSAFRSAPPFWRGTRFGLVVRFLSGRCHFGLAIALRRLLLTFRQSRLTPFGINFDVRASTHVFFPAARPLYLFRDTPSHGRYTRRCTSVCFGSLLFRASFLSFVHVYFRTRKLMCPSAHAPVAAPAFRRSSSPARLFARFRRGVLRSFGRLPWLSPGLVPTSLRVRGDLKSFRFFSSSVYAPPTVAGTSNCRFHALLPASFPRSATRRIDDTLSSRFCNGQLQQDNFCTNTPPVVLWKK